MKKACNDTCDFGKRRLVLTRGHRSPSGAVLYARRGTPSIANARNPGVCKINTDLVCKDDIDVAERLGLRDTDQRLVKLFDLVECLRLAQNRLIR